MRWAVLAAALLALPAGAAFSEGSGPPVAVQATAAADTTLYFHIARGGDFPLTTQAPDPSVSLDDGLGLATHSLSCVPPGTPLDGLTQHEYTTYYGYAAMGQVVAPQQAQPAGLLQPGIAADVLLDPAAPLALRWFLSTYAGVPLGGSGDPVPVPGVVVRATVRLGETFSPYDTAYNEGEVVAQGQTPPTTLAGAATAPTPLADASAATPGAEVRYAGTVNGAPVYGFTLPMAALRASVPQADGFNVRVDVFQRLPTCPGPGHGYVMANVVRLHTSEGLRPRLELRERDPLRIEASLEQFLEAQVLQVSVRSPWGRSDLDSGNATLVAPGARFVQVAGEPSRFTDSRERQPLGQVWVWNRTLEPGGYTATYSVGNRQHSASAQAGVTFQVGAKATPGAGAVAALLLLGAAAAWRRR
jgi:hypothetical protein